MRSLYPEIEPRRDFMLEVDTLHRLYVEESGNPNGLPVLFLHGGPGAGCEAAHRRFFNADAYRIILFDQRGCGRSQPHAALENNTTHHLIADIETIRRHLGISQWVLFGGSWGSTLALAYAETYPQHCLALILRGIFLCRARDLSWFYQEGANFLLPDLWQDYISIIPPAERDQMMRAYHQRLTSPDKAVQLQAAQAWARWEGAASTLKQNTHIIDFFTQPDVALSLARIECHYFINDVFLSPNQLLNNAHQLADIPGVIVHGRYDIVCPVEQAWLLKAAWPQAELHIISDAGHSAFELGIIDRLVRSSDAIAQQLGAA